MTQQPEDPAAKYIPVLTQILEVCEQYAPVFGTNEPIHLQIYSFWAAPGELDWIAIRRDSGNCKFIERDFTGVREGATIMNIAQSLSDYEKRSTQTSPEYVWDNFARNFKHPLGRYLADRELKGLAARLKFDPKPQPEPEHA